MTPHNDGARRADDFEIPISPDNASDQPASESTPQANGHDHQQEPARNGFDPEAPYGRGPKGRPLLAPGAKPFQKGQGGRTKGSRNKSTLIAMKMLDEQAKGVTQKCIQMALEGNEQALKLCMERLVAPRKDRPIAIDLPQVNTAVDAIRALTAVIEATGTGQITPVEAIRVGQVIGNFLSLTSVMAFDERLARLETENGIERHTTAAMINYDMSEVEQKEDKEE